MDTSVCSITRPAKRHRFQPFVVRKGIVFRAKHRQQIALELSKSKNDSTTYSDPKLIKLRSNNRALSRALTEQKIENKCLFDEKIQLQQEILSKHETILALQNANQTHEEDLARISEVFHSSAQLLVRVTEQLNLGLQRCATGRRRSKSISLGTARSSRSSGRATGSSDLYGPAAATSRKLHKVLPTVAGNVISHPSIVLPRLPAGGGWFAAPPPGARRPHQEEDTEEELEEDEEEPEPEPEPMPDSGDRVPLADLSVILEQSFLEPDGLRPSPRRSSGHSGSAEVPLVRRARLSVPILSDPAGQQLRQPQVVVPAEERLFGDQAWLRQRCPGPERLLVPDDQPRLSAEQQQEAAVPGVASPPQRGDPAAPTAAHTVSVAAADGSPMELDESIVFKRRTTRGANAAAITPPSVSDACVPPADSVTAAEPAPVPTRRRSPATAEQPADDDHDQSIVISRKVARGRPGRRRTATLDLDESTACRPAASPAADEPAAAPDPDESIVISRKTSRTPRRSRLAGDPEEEAPRARQRRGSAVPAASRRGRRSLAPQQTPTAPDAGCPMLNGDIGTSSPELGTKQQPTPSPELGTKQQPTPSPELGTKQQPTRSPELGTKQQPTCSPELGTKQRPRQRGKKVAVPEPQVRSASDDDPLEGPSGRVWLPPALATDDSPCADDKLISLPRILLARTPTEDLTPAVGRRATQSPAGRSPEPEPERLAGGRKARRRSRPAEEEPAVASRGARRSAGRGRAPPRKRQAKKKQEPVPATWEALLGAPAVAKPYAGGRELKSPANDALFSYPDLPNGASAAAEKEKAEERSHETKAAVAEATFALEVGAQGSDDGLAGDLATDAEATESAPPSLNASKRAAEVGQAIDPLPVTEAAQRGSPEPGQPSAFFEPLLPREPTSANESVPAMPPTSAERLVAQESFVERPVAQESSVERPVAQESSVERPVAQESSVERPVAQESSVERPVAQEFSVERPVAQEFSVERPVAQEFSVERLVTQEFSVERLPSRQPQLRLRVAAPSPPSGQAQTAESSSGRSSPVLSQENSTGGRRRRAKVSYAEPSLNKKMRR